MDIDEMIVIDIDHINCQEWVQKIYAHAGMGVLHPLWNKNRRDPLVDEFLDV